MTKRKRNPQHASVRAALDDLYAQLPSLDCKGLCADSCGPIDMSDAERTRIAEQGTTINPQQTKPGTLTCVALNETFGAGRCTVYPIRPMICRLWGVAESMPCAYGCQPSGGLIPDATALDYLAQALVLGGSHHDGKHDIRKSIANLSNDPTAQPLIARLIRGDRTVEPQLLQRMNQLRDQGTLP